MKNIYLFLLSSLIFLVSCDPVSRDERLVEIPAVTVQHNVLIEEFTGQRCIFCPEAATAIVQLQNSYEELERKCKWEATTMVGGG